MDLPQERCHRAQFTLATLLECFAWGASPCGYVAYLANRPHTHNGVVGVCLIIFSPLVIAGCVGGAAGCLFRHRWRGLMIGLVIGALPLLHVVASVVRQNLRTH